LIILVIGAIYFIYAAFFKPISSGCAFLTNKRLIFANRLNGKGLERFTLESVKVDSIIGVDTAKGLLLRDGNYIGNITGTIAENAFCDILNSRY
jgi:hypothetical protein